MITMSWSQQSESCSECETPVHIVRRVPLTWQLARMPRFRTREKITWRLARQLVAGFYNGFTHVVLTGASPSSTMTLD